MTGRVEEDGGQWRTGKRGEAEGDSRRKRWKVGKKREEGGDQINQGEKVNRRKTRM